MGKWKNYGESKRLKLARRVCKRSNDRIIVIHQRLEI